MTQSEQNQLQVEFLNALEFLRKRLAGITDIKDVELLGIEIERLIARFRSEIPGGQLPVSARAMYERVRMLDPDMVTLQRRWTDVRQDVGIRAAEEIRSGYDLLGGWRKRWGAMVEPAWRSRQAIAETGDEADFDSTMGLSTRQRLQSVARRGLATRGGGDLILALDLRYAAGLALAEIADLLAVSPPAIQMRISAFEARVYEMVAREVVDRQMPDGWQLVETSEGRSSYGSDLLLRRIGDRERGFIAIDVVPVWEGRESTVGRPRMVTSAPTRSRPGRVLHIWAVVFPEGPRIRFIPASEGVGRLEGRNPSTSDVIESALSVGFDILGDAIASTSVQQRLLDGGSE